VCGFAGFVGYNGFCTDKVESIASSMGNAIFHRGPDDFGNWHDDRAEIMLVHRRLSILDLSAAGHQPMISSSGRFIIAFNGEIYNHLDLRGDLKDRKFIGHSDTETLLSLIETYGVVSTLNKIVGMFSFALWDRDKNNLYLARDRMGEKPLYYGWQNNIFIFGSELKAFKAHPAFRGEIDRDSIAMQLRNSCIPAPHSIYKGVKKLLPGTYLTLSMKSNGFFDKNLSKPKKYWSLAKVAEDGIKNQIIESESTIICELDGLLSQSVRDQMIADVPLGSFLSGGVDSH